MQLFASCYFLLGQESCACAHILFRNVSEFSFIVGSTTFGTTRINLKSYLITLLPHWSKMITLII